MEQVRPGCGRGKEEKNRMKKRVLALLVLAVMLCTALPAAAAGKYTQVEDFTAEAAEGVLTVKLPEGYADKGYFKLFWTNEATGETESAVFPVDTAEYGIETEEGAEYSLALFYAKKKGLLPSKLPEEKPEPEGPFEWNVLWIDVENNESFGFTNRMNEDNHRVSEAASAAFEALAEELTGGLVDIRITRITVEEPVTSMTYDSDWGYYISADDIDLKHYTLRQYDSVFIFSRTDGILTDYAGLASEPDSPREDAGYCNIVLVGDTAEPGLEDVMDCLCVHEWIHQLGYFYDSLYLEIANPDHPEDYGYTADDTLNPEFLGKILTMTACTEDGRAVGVPAKAWQYRPTHVPDKWDLSYMQEQPDPAAAKAQDGAGTEDGESPWAPEGAENPEIYGRLTETGYENTVMGIGCAGFEDWISYSHDEFLATHTVESALAEDEDTGAFEGDVIVLYAKNGLKPEYMDVWYVPSGAEIFREKSTEQVLQELAESNRQNAEQYGWEDYSCEIVEVPIGDRTFSGIKSSYTVRTVRFYYLDLFWPDGDHVNMIGAGTAMFDTCEEILGCFYLLEE